MAGHPRPFVSSLVCLLPAVLGTLAAPSSCQDPPARPSQDQKPEETLERSGDGERLLITASRTPQTSFDAAASTEILDFEDLFRRSYRTLPQMLRDVPGVLVQETSVSQGSPFIRGWTGYHNVVLIDGIRLNNSVFRSGPNQYWATIDSLNIDRLELVRGPSSALYGSDAVGGTLQVFTRDPWTDGPGFTQGASSLLRYASADKSIMGRGEVSLGFGHDDGSHTGVLIGGDRKVFQDLEGGSGIGEMPYTAYDEWAFDAKVVHRLDDNERLVFAFQRFRQNDAPRTHRTPFAKSWRGTTIGNELIHEFDHDRTLAYAQYHAEELGGAIDAIHASVSFHSQKEDRLRVRTGNRIDNQGFDVDTYGIWLQFESFTEIGHLTYGVEWYRDRVDSFTIRNTPSATDTIQGPVGDDASYDLAAIFLQDEVDLGGNWSMTLGGRFNYAAADIGSALDPVTNTQIAIDDSWSDAVFNARIRHELVEDQVAVFAGVSQGFRAPNLSDLSRFDSARTNEFEVPSFGLNSERFTTFEVGVKAQGDRHAVQAGYYWTDIQDLINRFPTGNVLPGGEFEITKDNVGDGYVWGLEFGGTFEITDSFSLFGNASYQEGRIENFAVGASVPTEEYLSRLLPLSGLVGLRYEEPTDGRFWAETMVRLSADANKLNSADRGDTQRIPPGGTPGYAVWDIGAGVLVRDDTTLNFRIENITDMDYRVHGSGTNMPGRNFVMVMETRF